MSSKFKQKLRLKSKLSKSLQQAQFRIVEQSLEMMTIKSKLVDLSKLVIIE